MKSMFSPVMFGDKDGGMVSLSPKLGQRSQLGQLPDFLQNIIPESFDDLAASISDVIAKLPPEVAGTHQAELEKCKADIAKGGADAISGGKCLYDLFQVVKNELQNQTIPTTPIRTMAPVSSTSSFPWVPVALGVGAVGLLIFALTRGK